MRAAYRSGVALAHVPTVPHGPGPPAAAPLLSQGHASSPTGSGTQEQSVTQAPDPQLASSSSTSSSSSASSDDRAPVPAASGSMFADLHWILYRRRRGGPAYLHRCLFDTPGVPGSGRPSCCKTRASGLLYGSGLAEAAEAAGPLEAQWCKRCAADVHAFCRETDVASIWSRP